MGITIGADPEFILENDGSFVAANEYMCFESALGTDGASATAEVRPQYGHSSLELVANIRKLFQDGVDNIHGLDNLQFLAGHYKHERPIGGHIHLAGFPFVPERLGKRLDLVHSTLSDCIDNIPERERRHRCGYGNGWRVDRGSDYIEYRAPGSWLLSPQVAFMACWLAEATAYAYINKQKKPFTVLQELGSCAGILSFAHHVKNIPHKDLFMKTADVVFSHLPLDWEQDFKPNWL